MWYLVFGFRSAGKNVATLFLVSIANVPDRWFEFASETRNVGEVVADPRVIVDGSIGLANVTLIWLLSSTPFTSWPGLKSKTVGTTVSDCEPVVNVQVVLLVNALPRVSFASVVNVAM